MWFLPFFLLLLASVVWATPLLPLPPGTWTAVPSHLIDVCFNWPAGTNYGSGLCNVLTESGAVYDTKRDCLVLWGGGHGDYAGNEFYSFCLQTRQWTRLNDPSLSTDSAGVTALSGYYPDASGQPDPQQPRSGHSYQNMQYVPSLDAYCLFGIPVGYPGTSYLDHTVCWSPVTRHWSALPSDITQKPMVSIGSVTATHPLTQVVYALGTIYRYWLASWAPTTNTWHKLSPLLPNEQYAYYRSAVIDPVRNTLVAVGGSNAPSYTIDLGQPTITLQPLAMTGAEAIHSGRRNPGLAYYPSSGQVVAWNGGASLYALDVPTRTWTEVQPAPGNTVTPTNPYSTGTYTRFAYSEKFSVFVLVNGLKDDVYLYRPGVSLSPDPLRPAMNLRILFP